MMFLLFKLVFKFGKLFVSLLLLVCEGIIWLGYILWGLLIRIVDLIHARSSFQDGELHCPQGHLIPTFGETYECSECSAVFTGSIWQCPNPECQAVTPYINCPDCGLSVRNPYRWGRP